MARLSKEEYIAQKYAAQVAAKRQQRYRNQQLFASPMNQTSGATNLTSVALYQQLAQQGAYYPSPVAPGGVPATPPPARRTAIDWLRGRVEEITSAAFAEVAA